MQSSAQSRPELSRTALAAQLVGLGVEKGGVLLVHMSYRAVRPVEGGPGGVIQALCAAVGVRGTIVMPSWSGDDDVPFDVSGTAVCSSLGVTADVFWRQPGARRSSHPFAFAALGPEATHITVDPLPLPPHCPRSPVGRVYELDGRILLLGVGHDANTTVHLAEVIARVPYRVAKYCTVLEGSRPVRVEYVENDHCCERFALVDEWLRQRGLQREGPVGNTTARLMRSRDVVRVVTERLGEDPLLFLHHPQDGCTECDEARRSVDPATTTI
jgi:aminoglycoside N3'-acetyltransferase